MVPSEDTYIKMDSYATNGDMLLDDLNDSTPTVNNNGDIYAKIDELDYTQKDERYSTTPCIAVPKICRTDEPPPLPVARSLESMSSIQGVGKPELPSRKLKPQYSLTQTSVGDGDDDDSGNNDDDNSLPPPLPKKMGRTHSNTSTISNNTSDP